MKIKSLFVPLLIVIASCKKTTTPNNNNPGNKAIGPFSIYAPFTCPENGVALLTPRIENSALQVSSVSGSLAENPIWYAKKINSNQFVIYDSVDNGYRVWYESPDNIQNCSLGDCGIIAMQFMSDIPASFAGKYLFSISIADAAGEQQTIITAPSGRSLLSSQGKNKNTGACTRSFVVFLSSSTSCKDLVEGTETYTYCFNKNFIFKKK